MASVMFFEEDEVSVILEGTGLRYGLVTESSEYFSSDEDDEYETAVYERLRKGTVRVSWYPDGQIQVLPESELNLADHSLMPGDVVRRFIKGEDSQRGYATLARIRCHLQVIGKPFVIRDIDTRDLLPMLPFSTDPGDVYLDSWVGRIVNISERVILRFSDGARCEASDEETIGLLLEFTDVFHKQSKNSTFAPLSFYEGQVLKGDLGSLQDVKWLKTTKQFNQSSVRKLQNREVIITVEKVEVIQLEINWICQGYSANHEATPTIVQPPPRIIKGDILQRVKKLDCFEACNYQVGERALYILKDSDRIVRLNPKDHRSAINQVLQPKNNASNESIHDNDEQTHSGANHHDDNQETLTSLETITDNCDSLSSNLDDGNIAMVLEATGSTSETPGESVSASVSEVSASHAKSSHEKKTGRGGMKRSAIQLRQLKKKKLKPAKTKLQYPVADLSLPHTGQKLPVEVIYTSTVVDVLWQDGSKELDILSTDLLPVHHLDELEFFPGDYVVSNSESHNLDVYGVIQSVDHRGRTCKVKWLKHNSSGSDSMVKMDEVSVFDIKDHPDLKFRAGLVVVRVSGEGPADETSGSDSKQLAVGQVYELGFDGSMLIRWYDGSLSSCYPQQLYLVSDELSELYSDSEDAYSSNDESSSVGSWEWETEEETQLPLENDDIVDKVIESSQTSSVKELKSVINDVRETVKKIEDFVTNLQPKSSISTKYFRLLTQFFRHCLEIDQIAGTSYFEDEELKAAMAEIKKMSKKGKSQNSSSQVPEVFNADKKEKENSKDKENSKPVQGQESSSTQDENGNDSGLEKSPSSSEFRDIDHNYASPSAEEPAALSEKDAPADPLCSDSISKLSNGLQNIAATEITVDNHLLVAAASSESVLVLKDAAKPSKSARSFAELLVAICEQLEKLAKPWFTSESDEGKVCVRALTMLRQVITTNTENLTTLCRSSCLAIRNESSECSLSCTTSSDSSTSFIKNGVLDSENSSEKSGKPPHSDAEKTGVQNKGLGLQLTLSDIQASESALDEDETMAKTPVTPAEIRAKVEFNPEGFTLIDSLPEFHHYKDQKHFPFDAKTFTNTIRKEMKLLHSCLPNGIYVKGFESRMDLFSIMIEGPSRTPYEDGLFFFDVQLPNNYPSSPPMFFYISYCSDRLNPNLYEDGKVCVSLLGTWTGKGTEIWSSKSNLLQVLISIQGLILNPEPYYNEAGYERQKGTQLGLENSRMYNEMAILKMVQSMTKIAINPFQPFSTEIRLHLKKKAYRLISRLRYWLNADDCFTTRTENMENGHLDSELSLSKNAVSESKSTGATTSSPLQTSDSTNMKSDGEELSPSNGSLPSEHVPLNLTASLGNVDIEITTPNCQKCEESCDRNFPAVNNTSEPRSQNSVEVLEISTADEDMISLPAFPLLPLSKGFKLSLAKNLDYFESTLKSIGIQQS